VSHGLMNYCLGHPGIRSGKPPFAQQELGNQRSWARPTIFL
jgi:hypothetical protein